MTLLAIDPGLDTGWALFNMSLVSCGVGDPRSVVPCHDHVFIEKPQVYDVRHSKGDPNDLITLAIQVGEYKQFYSLQGAAVSMYLPREWKAQVPKGICAARILSKLSAREKQVVHECGTQVAAGLQHNMMDAIGIGLFALKRTKVGCQ